MLVPTNLQWMGRNGHPNLAGHGAPDRCARARGREALPPAGEVLGAGRLARGARRSTVKLEVFPRFSMFLMFEFVFIIPVFYIPTIPISLSPFLTSITRKCKDLRVGRSISNQWCGVECRGSFKGFVGLIRLVFESVSQTHFCSIPTIAALLVETSIAGQALAIWTNLAL